MADRRSFPFVADATASHGAQWAGNMQQSARHPSSSHHPSGSHAYATNAHHNAVHSTPPYGINGQSPPSVNGYSAVPPHPYANSDAAFGAYPARRAYLPQEQPISSSSHARHHSAHSHNHVSQPYPAPQPSRNSLTMSPPHLSGYAPHPHPASVMPTIQYPASPTRPFSCDLCALSFNRQHDLKRHRETHSGEKPFLCNGGCGKTFTRKDALKRHQLVKHCGHEEDV
ncbi:hypothetical protein BJ138DRAFT_1156229 [Hygrophoropsis aurantiaca]|uniref:Uncharacterized protein n=1 Tax=Hygrophoropsis aurantiaca TaxID=72124 RepID=A0ACB8A718_9AGAM|nr:hypothetical protein BJ138DRAFT_1156229 [Hygrophoropsis aurantiaca]